MEGRTLKNTQPPPREASRRRGTALILVLVVTVGIFGMIVVLFTLGRTNASSQRENNQRVDIQMLMRSAIADAYEEIVTKADSGADGLGNVGLESCLGLDSWSGTPTERGALGRNLRVIGGRTLGKYMACVETLAGNERILHVAVAYPDFENPRQSLGASLRLSQALGGKNALTFSGPLHGSSNFEVGSPSTADHRGALLVIKDTEGVYPALNVNDSEFFNEQNFAELIEMLSLPAPGAAIQPQLYGKSYYGGVGVAIPSAKVSNALGTTPAWSGVPGSDFDTISQYTDAQIRLNEGTVNDAAGEILQWVSDIENAGNRTEVKANSGNTAFITTLTLMGRYDPNDPSQTDLYELNDAAGDGNETLDVQASINGKGVLLIRDGNGISFDGRSISGPHPSGTLAEMNWEGDVIWVVSGNDRMRFRDGFHMNIKGNLFVVTAPSVTGKRALIEMEPVDPAKTYTDRANRLVIDGGSAVFVAAGSGPANEIEFDMKSKSGDYGNEVIVWGLWVTLGDKISMSLRGDDGGDAGKHFVGAGFPGDDGSNYEEPDRGRSNPTARQSLLTNPNAMADFFLWGSMVVAIPETATGGLQKWEWIQGIYGVLEYDDAIYEQELGELSARIPSLISWKTRGYVEVAGARKIETMVALISADMAADGAFTQLGN